LKVIEKDLTRIAVALEKIAYALQWKNEFMEANHQTSPINEPKNAEELTAVAESIVKVFEPLPVKETPATHDTIGTGKTITTQFGSVTIPADEVKEPAPEDGFPTMEELKEAGKEIKFEEVSKEFFALLNRIKETKGLDEAKQVATDLIREYNNGKPISLATLPKEAYAPLFEKITAARVQYEPA
jgi:hypothetical protein